MKKMATDGDPLFLPEEIITNILKRLPVKSLIRFQCVCKHWKNLIKTPSFIADHCHHSSNQNPLLLLQWDSKCDPLHLHMLDSEMRVLQVQPSPLINSLSCVRILGSSNGLLWLKINSTFVFPPSFLLWNPAIREVRQVPRNINDFESSWYYGFGFSPIVNDYKIVMFREDGFDKGHNHQVEVYSLSTGSWKEIEVENFQGACLYGRATTANGALFWYGRRVVENSDRVIISFDLAKEVFTLIPMPALVDSYTIGPLTVYENKLAIFSHTKIENSESYLINLWVMEEGTSAFRERRSWINKYTIRNSSGMFFPSRIWGDRIVCYSPSHSGFLFDDTECEAKKGVITVLSLLNLRTHELENFATRKCGVHILVTWNYTESLVSVRSIHIEEP